MSDLKITVPDMGDFKDVEIIEVLVKEGQTINKNHSLITLESDKSSVEVCLLYTSPSPRDKRQSRMPSSA